MKQSGFLFEIRPTDYVLGSTSPLQGEELNPDGDWRQWAPAEERQSDANFDTMSCTTFSGTSKLETLFNFLLEKKKFSGVQEKWLRDEGYIVDKKFNFSDRFSATINGTMPNGNYFQNVWDSFRKDGLLPEKDHPFGGKNQKEYLDQSKITQQMRDKAKKFLELIIEKDANGYKINYEWVPVTETGVELADAFKQAPIQVAVTKENPGHAILLLKMDWEWESYKPFLRPRKRSVAYALKCVVVLKTEAPVVTPAQPDSKEVEYFNTKEFVSREVYNQFGENSLWFVDPRIRKLANFIRTFFASSVTINNWQWNGSLDERGFRQPDSTEGAVFSQHRFGRAIDFNVKGKTPKQVYDIILANKEVFMQNGLTCIEDVAFTPTWTHVDIRYTGLKDILIVKP